MLKRSLFVIALLMSAATMPAHADDISNRVDALEEQIRQLTGQIEQLNFQLKQMQTQAPQKMGSVVQPPQAAPQQAAVAPIKKLIMPKAQAQADQGVETIDETPVLPQMKTAIAPARQAGAAPAATTLGDLANSAAQNNDGGFQGQVLVAPGVDDTVAANADQTALAEPASMEPETPDDLFLRSEKSLLQLQYGDAESGFKEFIAKYPEHNLAGSAEFKLGETFYAQQNYSEAAQSYMASYKQYPKGRRAPDSLLKLGLALSRLGQKDQACATISSVDSEFPNAVEIKKRAQAEFKRAGC
jgi:tol-pal system protein YbgF